MQVELINNTEDNTADFKPGSLYIMAAVSPNKGSIAVFGLESKELHEVGGDGTAWDTPLRSQWRELPAGTIFVIKEEE